MTRSLQVENIDMAPGQEEDNEEDDEACAAAAAFWGVHQDKVEAGGPGGSEATSGPPPLRPPQGARISMGGSQRWDSGGTAVGTTAGRETPV
jgi:hypothetical protein